MRGGALKCRGLTASRQPLEVTGYPVLATLVQDKQLEKTLALPTAGRTEAAEVPAWRQGQGPPELAHHLWCEPMSACLGTFVACTETCQLPACAVYLTTNSLLRCATAAQCSASVSQACHACSPGCRVLERGRAAERGVDADIPDGAVPAEAGSRPGGHGGDAGHRYCYVTLECNLHKHLGGLVCHRPALL